MLTNLLFRLSTLARQSAQDETGLRVEVCPPSLDDHAHAHASARGKAPRAGNRWLDSLSLWWRGTAANASRASASGDMASAETALPAGPQFLESTQLPDADTRLCARVCDATATGFGRRNRKSSKLARQLAVARAELGETLTDLHPDKKRDLQWRIRQAQTLRELWHLRPEVFTLISLQHNQREADRRLASVNRHFPVRAPKSTFDATQIS